MITRVDEPVREAVVITRQEYEADKKRGYAITIWSPEMEEVITDKRSGRSVTHKTPAVLNYCCMNCQFSTTDLDLMNTHKFHDEHPWKFTPFNSPYGHCADVVIEGIDNYQATLETGE